MRTSSPAATASRYARASAKKSLSCWTCSSYVGGFWPPGPPNLPPPPPRPKRRGLGLGQFTLRAAADSIDISSQLHPSRFIAEDMPETSPPPGVLNATRTPAEREVPMWRLSALTATSARTFGLKSPSSLMSLETSTEPISLIPTVL